MEYILRNGLFDYSISFFLQAEYPRSTTMLSKANNKYYLKNTGELYTGQVLNMSKKLGKNFKLI